MINLRDENAQDRLLLAPRLCAQMAVWSILN